MLTPNGVYMINIIDAYETDEHAEEDGQEKDRGGRRSQTPPRRPQIRREALAEGTPLRRLPGAWTETAKLRSPTFIFSGPTQARAGPRETFVVVASMKPLDLNDLGHRDDDPKFYSKGRRTEPKPYGPGG